MKTILSFLILSLSISLYSQDITEKEIKSEVASVTVFFESAQVTRNKNVSVEQGKTVLKYTSLSPFIDAKSIQAKVNGAVNVLSVNHQQNFIKDLEKPAELVKLEEQLKTVQEKIKLESTYISIISEEISFLQSNKVIGGNNQSVSISSLREASDFYGTKFTSLKLKEIERRNTLESFQKERAKLVNQISTITSKKEYASGEILITVNAKSRTSIDIDLTYVVSNAGWYPSYDIKAVSVEKPLEIVYKANVHQDTKVDWNNVKLSFSSNNPEISSVAPELQIYYLNYGSIPPGYEAMISQVEGIVSGSDGEALPGASIMVKGSTIGTSADMNGRYSLTVPPNAGTLKYSFVGCVTQELPIRAGNMNVSLQYDLQGLDEVVVTAYGTNRNMSEMELDAAPSGRSLKSKSIRLRESSSIPMPVAQVRNQTSVEFEISMPYSVKSDSKNYVVDMAAYEVPAYYEYKCIPKISKDAFLIANIEDWEEMNLLEGEANLFLEDTYVGKSILDVRFASDTLSLSLGRDKNVSVSREKIKDIKTKRFIGTKQEDTRAWQIDVRNNKAQKINMIILDQVPVPMNTEIELDIANRSGAEYNDKNGELKWSFSLDPQDKKVIRLKYSIKYPKNKHLIIE
ncbi:MAG: mucoidy inhibitor MuiA family protein [Bacteroidales bacterium]|nr:mucoidy inhibitor MuiA family protein [Bacteroidales bacterium]